MINVNIYPTKKCNLECEHCMFECSPANDEVIADGHLEYCKNFLVWLATNNKGLSDVCISGGEPFLYPNIYELIMWMSRFTSRRNLRWSLCTNGTIPPDKTFIKKLSDLQFPIPHIRISSSRWHDAQLKEKKLKQQITKFTALCQEPSVHRVVMIMDKGRAVELLKTNPSEYYNSNHLCINQVNFPHIDIAFKPKFISFCSEDDSLKDSPKYVMYEDLFKMLPEDSYKYLLERAYTWHGIMKAGNCKNKCTHYTVKGAK